MAKVIVKAKHLQAIADAIRECNGRQVLYKPREMANAIDNLPNRANTNHEYRVTINQSPHQTIYVRRFLQPYEIEHHGSFNVSEPMFFLEITIVPEEGYRAGTLNHSGVVQLDRDMIVEATPATEV